MNSSSTIFSIQPERLDDLANKYRLNYSTASPFPHVIIDDFFPESVLNNIINEFPKPDEIDWEIFAHSRAQKLGSTSELQMGEATRLLLYQLNSGIFINFLERLTGIAGIIPDPHFWGGGLHQIERGGYLKIHADFNRHPKLSLDRRLNLILYLNQDWPEEYGGHLEMWNRDLSRCEQKILPIFNRCVIFNCTSFSYHGHPEPLNCPSARTRRSLAVYYYTNGQPSDEIAAPHSSRYPTRPGEKSSRSTDAIKAIFKKFIPPIAIDIKNYLKNR
ncbi:MAG: 2OG-Fe(II) oxygenase [Cyanosarcina radialis HA8281-LM2]|jgi:hypothetical protein|nr:2OG-Fe(II) oxygenase [Cyanosarcina radialis HA8281-LM2]